MTLFTLESSKNVEVLEALTELGRIDVEMSKLLILRWEEADRSEQANCRLAEIVLRASVLEGYILALCAHESKIPDPFAPNTPTAQETLKNAIDLVISRRWLQSSFRSLLNWVLETRNCVHPVNELALSESVRESAPLVKANVSYFLAELSKHVNLLTRDSQVAEPTEYIKRAESERLVKLIKQNRKIIQVTGMPGVGKSVMVEQTISKHNELKNLYTFSISVDSASSEYLVVTKVLAALKRQLRQQILVTIHAADLLSNEGLNEIVSCIAGTKLAQLVTTSLQALPIPVIPDLSSSIVEVEGLEWEGENPPALRLLKSVHRDLHPRQDFAAANHVLLRDICRKLEGNPILIQSTARSMPDLSDASLTKLLEQIGSRNVEDDIRDSFSRAFEDFSEGCQVWLKVAACYPGGFRAEHLTEVAKGMGSDIELDSAGVPKELPPWVIIRGELASLTTTFRRFLLGHLLESGELGLLRERQLEGLLNRIYGVSLTSFDVFRDDAFIAESLVVCEDCLNYFTLREDRYAPASRLAAALIHFYIDRGLLEHALRVSKMVDVDDKSEVSDQTIQLIRARARLSVKAFSDYAEVERNLKRAISGGATKPLILCVLWQDLGDTLWEEGHRLEEAKECFESVIRLLETESRHCPEVRRLKGRSYEQLGNLERVKGEHQRSLDYIDKARSEINIPMFPVKTKDYMLSWLALQECNSVFLMGLHTPSNAQKWWSSCYVAARGFATLEVDGSIPFVAERALQASVEMDLSHFVGEFFVLASELREATNSATPPLDETEYLRSVKRTARTLYAADYKSGSARSLPELREALLKQVALTQEFVAIHLNK